MYLLIERMFFTMPMLSPAISAITPIYFIPDSKVLMGNDNPQKAENPSAAVPSQPEHTISNSKVRSSSISARNADVESLKKSKTFSSKVGGGAEESNIRYEEYKLTKVPHFRQTAARANREEDYAMEMNAVRQSRMAGEINSLSFKMDKPDGVSEQAHIYTFDYDRTLNHYINFVKADGRSSIMQQSAIK